MAATKQQLAALKKARAARAKNLAKKKAPAKRKSNPASNQYYVVITTYDGRNGVLTSWDKNGPKFDDDARKAKLFDRKGADTLSNAIFSTLSDYVESVAVHAKKPNAGRGRKANPVPASKAYKAKQAIELYENFTGHSADFYQNIPVDWPEVGLKVGECDGILYSTIRDGVPEKYIHRFKKSARPVLVADHDGSQLALIGGNFDFTPRGIVDK